MVPANWTAERPPVTGMELDSEISHQLNCKNGRTAKTTSEKETDSNCTRVGLTTKTSLW
jgi:hypothetical protein